MSLINITVVEDTTQLVAGIPEYVSLSTDVPSMIFYTLDGTTPNTESDVYIEPIKLPNGLPTVVLKIYATDGTNVSDVIIKTYSPNWTGQRSPRAIATIDNSPSKLAPCVVGSSDPKVIYSLASGPTVDFAAIPNTVSDGYGYNPSIYPMRGSDKPIPVYDLLYSDSNSKGEMGKDIGTLPAKTTILYAPPDPEETDANKATFNPKAMVMFHDGRDEKNNTGEIFRQYFDTENWEKANGGGKYSSTAFMEGDGSPTGSFISYHYNEKQNTITYYYRDSRTSKWIISTEPFNNAHTATRAMDLWAKVVTRPSIGGGFVYKWLLFSKTSLL